MKRILISGLVNTETTVPVRRFPVEYYPIDYPFFGVNTAVSGVAFNIARALQTLGDDVTLLSMIGDDFSGAYVRDVLKTCGICTEYVHGRLNQTPSSVVLYDAAGKRQIYCDLKDIQETAYPLEDRVLENVDLVVACNINFNRPLLQKAKSIGKIIATDVHVLGDVRDGYNRDFLEAADILFLSDEALGEDYKAFLLELAACYPSKIIVLGRGSQGTAMYLREEGMVHTFPAAHVGPVVNTVGAGDALFSAFVHYYAAGMRPVDALRRAQVFAAAKIRVSGAAKGFIREEEVERWL